LKKAPKSQKTAVFKTPILHVKNPAKKWAKTPPKNAFYALGLA